MTFFIGVYGNPQTIWVNIKKKKNTEFFLIR